MPSYYDPNHAPNPQDWLELDEDLRISQAERHHKRNRIRLPSMKAHSVFHVIIENQIAENHEAVVRAMERLSTQGLDRHDCIHAIAWVCTQYMHELMTSGTTDPKEVANARYFAAVERLQANDWLSLAQS